MVKGANDDSEARAAYDTASYERFEDGTHMDLPLHFDKLTSTVHTMEVVYSPVVLFFNTLHAHGLYHLYAGRNASAS